MDWEELLEKTVTTHNAIKKSNAAIRRGITGLLDLGAIKVQKVAERKWHVTVLLDWPARITEGGFFEKVKEMPKAKTFDFFT